MICRYVGTYVYLLNLAYCVVLLDTLCLLYLNVNEVVVLSERVGAEYFSKNRTCALHNKGLMDGRSSGWSLRLLVIMLVFIFMGAL